MDEVYTMAKEIGVEKQLIFKSSDRYDKIKPLMEKAPDAMFMPIIRLDHKDSLEKLEEYEAHLKPFAYEIIPMKENSEQMDRVKTIAREGRHLWINSLWDSLNLGHSDDKAVNDPEGNWGWILEKGATIIQTDRPAYLIKYLESKGCRWK